jgi:hypothetical protein
VARNRLCTAISSKRYADAPDLVFVLVVAMDPVPPIHRSTFFVVGDIGHEHPTNLLGMDGSKWW